MSELLSEEEFDRCIDWLCSSGEDVSADALQAERATRLAAESRLAEVEMERDRLRGALESGRQFVIRHPALSLVDLAEFDAFIKLPAALDALARAALSKEKT